MKNKMKKLSGNVLIALAGAFFIASCSAGDKQWRSLEVSNTVLLTLPHGQVVIELAPQFSPQHVKQFSQLLKQRFYDGTRFYRVIDGFVAQAGPKEGGVKEKSLSILTMEGDWTVDSNWSFTKVQDNDLFAQQTGFKDSFAIAYAPPENKGDLGKAWLTHCPGTLAMARGNEADSGSGHFYFVIGQAPRYLDSIMTIFGRVVYGMQHIQSIQRTAAIEGEHAVDSQEHTPIVTMQLMSDVPKEKRLIIEVEKTESQAFAHRLEKRRARADHFFYKKPPPVLDVCQVPVRSRLVKTK